MLHCVKKCRYLELFWSVLTRIRTEYGQIQSISLYSAQMPENMDQNNSEYGNFSRSVTCDVSNFTINHFYARKKNKTATTTNNSVLEIKSIKRKWKH